jgi:hypothetical protein
MSAGLETENQPTEARVLFTQSRRSASFCVVPAAAAVVIIIIIIMTGN